MAEFNRYAVVTLQGGGVYGLSLLGQLKHLVEKQGIIPVALAGASAGGIVASLYWSGLSCKEIADEFVRLAGINCDEQELKKTGSLTAITDLLGPFSKTGDDEFSPVMLENAKKHWDSMIASFFAGHRVGPAIDAIKLNQVRKILWNKAGFFPGDGLTKHLERMMKKSEPFKNLNLNEGEPLRFRHAQELVDKGKAFFPALYLTVTDLTDGNLKVISSIDPEYKEMPVALAARASGGFPFFFRPVEYELNQAKQEIAKHFLVDGGVFANFPMWLFSDDFRQNLAGKRGFSRLAWKPLLHVGLRREPSAVGGVVDSQLTSVGKVMMKMLTGGVRDEFEDRQTLRLLPKCVVYQKESSTGGPDNFLDLKSLNSTRIQLMVDRGQQAANEKVREIELSFEIPYNPSWISNPLQELRHTVEKLLNVLGQNVNVRVNCLVANNQDYFEKIGSVGMAGQPDENLKLKIHEGISGFVYTRRCAAMCNLSAYNQRHEQNKFDWTLTDENYKFASQAASTWMVAVPLFDLETRVPLKQGNKSAIQVPNPIFYTFPTRGDAVVYGVLSVDCKAIYGDNFSDKPQVLANELIIKQIFVAMEHVADDIVKYLRGSFGNLKSWGR